MTIAISRQQYRQIWKKLMFFTTSNGQSITMFLQCNWHSLANSDGYIQPSQHNWHSLANSDRYTQCIHTVYPSEFAKDCHSPIIDFDETLCNFF